MAKQDSKHQTIQLTAEQLQELGRKISSILKLIELDQVAQEGVTVARHYDQSIFFEQAGHYLNAAQEVYDQVITDLDNVAYQLLECDNAENLEEYRRSKG